MTKEQLYEVMGDINEKHVKEAEKITKRDKKNTWVKWGAMAACLCLVIGGIIATNLDGSGSKGYTVNLSNGDSIVYHSGNTGEACFEVDFPTSTRELTDSELKEIFPTTSETQSARGTFNDETGELLRIEGKIGETTVILAQDGFPVNDVIIEGNETTSTVNGIPVTTGYFITKPNSRGEQLAIFFGSFKIGSINAYVELFGNKGDADTVGQNTAELIFQIIEHGEPKFSSISK